MIQILSKRAQEFLDSPRCNIKTVNEDTSLKLEWQFSFEIIKENDFQSDKILTLLYSCSPKLKLEMLFAEALCRLVVGKNISNLEKITFRELENYLRDENHLPVFAEPAFIEAQDVFKEVKNSLLAAIILKKIRDNSGLKDKQIPWSELPLVEKNRKIKALVFLLNSLFPKEKPLILALAEDDEISLILNDFPILPEVIEKLACGLFVISNEKSSLKVVAVQ